MYKEIGSRLKQARKEKILKQKDMAKKLGISRAGYSRIESGYVEITTKNLMKIAEILDISLDWLLLGKEEDQTKQGFFSNFGKYAGAVELLFNEMQKDETTMHGVLAAFFGKREKELHTQKEKEKEKEKENEQERI